MAYAAKTNSADAQVSADKPFFAIPMTARGSEQS
jgi:hypothetical protein